MISASHYIESDLVPVNPEIALMECIKRRLFNLRFTFQDGTSRFIDTVYEGYEGHVPIKGEPTITATILIDNMNVSDHTIGRTLSMQRKKVTYECSITIRCAFVDIPNPASTFIYASQIRWDLVCCMANLTEDIGEIGGDAFVMKTCSGSPNVYEDEGELDKFFVWETILPFSVSFLPQSIAKYITH